MEFFCSHCNLGTREKLLIASCALRASGQQSSPDHPISTTVHDRRSNEKLVEASRSGEDVALRPA
jgi:hypothetical protein